MRGDGTRRRASNVVERSMRVSNSQAKIRSYVIEIEVDDHHATRLSAESLRSWLCSANGCGIFVKRSALEQLLILGVDRRFREGKRVTELRVLMDERELGIDELADLVELSFEREQVAAAVRSCRDATAAGDRRYRINQKNRGRADLAEKRSVRVDTLARFEPEARAVYGHRTDAHVTVLDEHGDVVLET